MMNNYQPLYNYSSATIEVKLKDSANRIISVGENDTVYLSMSRTRDSTSFFDRVTGTVLDSTTGHVSFGLSVENTSVADGSVYIEVRLAGEGKERVVGEYDKVLLPSISRSIL